MLQAGRKVPYMSIYRKGGRRRTVVAGTVVGCVAVGTHAVITGHVDDDVDDDDDDDVDEDGRMIVFSSIFCQQRRKQQTSISTRIATA